MAQCHFCGAETLLFDAGTPVCVECDDKRQQKKKPRKPDGFSAASSDLQSVLFNRMNVARADYARLSKEADHKSKLAIDAGLNADGTLAWRQAYQAQREASEALKRYQRALQDFADFVSHGREP
jgi:hypothetical protein